MTSHESALERDFVTLTSFLTPAGVIQSQPVTIVFEDQGLRRRYTPDFLVTYSGGTDLVEVKYASDLEANWDRLAPAFSAAKQWANARNGRFRVVTEAEIRCGVLENAKRLLPLRALPRELRSADNGCPQMHLWVISTDLQDSPAAAV